MKARTKQEAFQHILAELDAGRLGAIDNDGGCVYESEDGKHCGVGCLFTPEQHEWIQSRGLNQDSIKSLIGIIGEDNIFHMTGMSLEELQTIQHFHDNGYTTKGENPFFRNYLVGKPN